MKRILGSLILFFASIAILQAQAPITITYDKSKKEPEKEILDQVSFQCLYQFTQKIEHGDEPFATDSMMLECGEKHSLYYNWMKAHHDSITNAKLPSTNQIESISVLKNTDVFDDLSSKGGSVVNPYKEREIEMNYKNRTESQLRTIVKDGGSHFQCTEDLSHQWTIHEDTLTVLGYLCQKATTTFRGRDYTAWFTMDIPINDGPWKLYGLPGLILLAKDKDELFTFTAIGIQKPEKEKDIVWVKEDYIKCNYKQMRDMKMKRLATGSVYYVNGGHLTMQMTKNSIVYNLIEL